MANLSSRELSFWLPLKSAHYCDCTEIIPNYLQLYIAGAVINEYIQSRHGRNTGTSEHNVELVNTMCIWSKLSIVNFLGKRNSVSFSMSMPITNSLSWKWIVRTSTPEKVIGEGARNRGGKEKFYYEVYFRFSSPAEFRICVQQYLLTEAMWWHQIAASALPLRLVCEF